MPNIGYGSNRKTRHVLPSGFVKFLVHNVKDLDLLLMHNRYQLLYGFLAEVGRKRSVAVLPRYGWCTLSLGITY